MPARGGYARSRRWCFTWFGEPGRELDEKPAWDEVHMKYLVYQQEECSTEEEKTGQLRKHYQGFVIFQNKKTMGACKKLLGSTTVHVEMTKGTSQEALAYCLDLGKEGTAKETQFEFGQRPSQGRRTDLEEVAKLITGGALLSTVAVTHPKEVAQYPRGLKLLESITISKQPLMGREQLEVLVYYGESRTGKTYDAVEEMPDAFIWRKPFKWWDHYNQETELIIDEYDGSLNICMLLGVLDRYKFPIEVKGDTTYANWTKVIITSNIDPRDWHPKAKLVHRQALAERVTGIKEFTERRVKRRRVYEPRVIVDDHPFVFVND